MHRGTGETDRGAGTFEYLALGVLAAVILGGLATIGTPVGAGAGRVICRITGGADHCASDGDPVVKRRRTHGPVKRRRAYVNPYKPASACTVGSASVTYKGNLTIASVDVGGGLTLLEQTDANGRVTMTAVDSHTAGGSVGAGAGYQWGKAINVGGDVSAGAKATYRVGDSWVFKDQKEADDYADAIVDDMYGRAAEYSGVTGVNVAGYLYRHRPWRPKLRKPDITRHEIEVDVSGGADAGADVGDGKTYKKSGDKGGKKKGTRRPGKHEATGKGGRHATSDSGGKHRRQGSSGRSGGRKGSDSDLAQGKGDVSVGQKATVEENHSAHTYAVTVGVSASGTGNGDVAAHRYQPKHPVGGTTNGAVKVTTDEHGRLLSVDLSQSATVNGTTTVTTSHLPVTDANREAVRKYLALNSANIPQHLTVDDLAPTGEPGSGATVLQREMYAHGQVSKVTYDTSSSSDPASVDVKAGLEFGVGVGEDTESQKVTGAQYLAGPGADGERRYVPWKECHA